MKKDNRIYTAEQEARMQDQADMANECASNHPRNQVEELQQVIRKLEATIEVQNYELLNLYRRLNQSF